MSSPSLPARLRDRLWRSGPTESPANAAPVPPGAPTAASRAALRGRRLTLTLAPAALLIAISLNTVLGSTGVLKRQAMLDELDDVQSTLADIERENQRMLLEIAILNRDPLATERAAAEELGAARPGSTLYRFAEPPRP